MIFADQQGALRDIVPVRWSTVQSTHTNQTIRTDGSAVLVLDSSRAASHSLVANAAHGSTTPNGNAQGAQGTLLDAEWKMLFKRISSNLCSHHVLITLMAETSEMLLQVSKM